MMVYLQVAHTNDEDCDLFSFSTLEHALRYIIDEHLAEWILSDMNYLENFGVFGPDDYTYIES